jgi:hypothetical protein
MMETAAIILLALLAGVVALVAPVRLRGGGGGRIEEERGCYEDSEEDAEAYRAGMVGRGEEVS